jgi:hypothetical protein
MGSSAKPNYPAPPVYPAPPAAPDMGPQFGLAIQNQQAQNEIALRQSGIAEKQLAIAEDRYGLSKEYRPLQERAMQDAARGRDPAPAEAVARNDVMQRVTPMHDGLSRAMQQGRGMKADSPNVVAAHEQLGAGLAGAQAKAQIDARDGATLANLQGKSDAVAAGKGIPGQAAQGMSAASGTLAAASQTMQQSTASYMDVLQAGSTASYQSAVSQWQYESSVMKMNYEYAVARANAEAESSQSLFSSAFGIMGMVAGGIIGNMILPGAGMLIGAGAGGQVGGMGGK